MAFNPPINGSALRLCSRPLGSASSPDILRLCRSTSLTALSEVEWLTVLDRVDGKPRPTFALSVSGSAGLRDDH